MDISQVLLTLEDLFKYYSYSQIFDRLLNLYISSIRTENLPQYIDRRFMELQLADKGYGVFFRDDIAGQFAFMNAAMYEPFDAYGIPQTRQVISPYISYQATVHGDNSVIIYNNMMHTSAVKDLIYYAFNIFDTMKSVMINLNAQRTPVLITCDEKQKQTFTNIYNKYAGGAPVIKGYNSQVNPNSIQVLKTDAPFVADKIYDMYTKLWGEALEYMGIQYHGEQKKERMITSEMYSYSGKALINRAGRMEARNTAYEQINAMFGLNLKAVFVGQELSEYGETYNTGEGEVIE